MRKQGVRLDTHKLSTLGLELADISYDLQGDLDEIAGCKLNVNSGKGLEKLFLAQRLPVSYGEPTDGMYQRGIMKGNPKFDKKTLTKYDNSLATMILEIRHIKTLLNLFIHPYPEFLVGDRLHCNFNPLRSDEYGTVSGRFSSSKPNLQQVSGKLEDNEGHSGGSELLNGLVIRKLFLPEEDCDWLKLDWSQIEYRFIAHYAIGEGSDWIRKKYNENPDTDYHDEMGELAGIEDRKIVKTFNFGGAYGMGIKKMAESYGWDLDEATYIYQKYHAKVPFLKETANRVGQKAKRVGFIKTILGRRARLPSSNKSYVMFNRLIQGGAADLMKKAMISAYDAGIFNTLPPHLTVHDELDVSVPRTREGREAAMELKNIMETCIKLKVPIRAEMEFGKNWGELKKVESL